MPENLFAWNEKRSAERATILRFLNEAQVRVNAAPGAIPLSSSAAGQTIAWLRTVLDIKPAQISSRDAL